MRRQLAVAVMALGSMGVASGCQTEVVTPVVASSVVVAPDDAGIVEGEDLQFTATVIDEFDQPVVLAVVTWSTDNPSIVRVDPDGRAYGLAPGSTLVWATFNGTSGSALMTVAPAVDLECVDDVLAPEQKPGKRGKKKTTSDDDDDDDDDDPDPDPRCAPPTVTGP
ncbi:MAG: Ig-like domain-containing protein [Gemmatimonadota bacterium]